MYYVTKDGRFKCNEVGLAPDYTLDLKNISRSRETEVHPKGFAHILALVLKPWYRNAVRKYQQDLMNKLSA